MYYEIINQLPLNNDTKLYILDLLILDNTKKLKLQCINEINYINKLYNDDLNFYGLNYFDNSYFSNLFFIFKYKI